MQEPHFHNFAKDAAFWRITVLLVCALSIGSVVYMYLDSKRALREAYGSIWVNDGAGNTFRATSSANSYNYPERKYEYEEQARDFARYRFEYDDGNFDDHIHRAAVISGMSYDSLVFDLEEEDVERHVMEDKWIYRVTVDSVLLDLQSRPKRGIVFARQLIEARRRKVLRNVFFSFELRDVSRKQLNSRGIRIENHDLFNTEIIRAEN